MKKGELWRGIWSGIQILILRWLWKRQEKFHFTVIRICIRWSSWTKTFRRSCYLLLNTKLVVCQGTPFSCGANSVVGAPARRWAGDHAKFVAGVMFLKPPETVPLWYWKPWERECPADVLDVLFSTCAYLNTTRVQKWTDRAGSCWAQWYEVWSSRVHCNFNVWHATDIGRTKPALSIRR